MWDRWLQGDSLHAIARLLDTSHTSIRRHLVATGGIRPLPRKRSNLALSLSEREEISRGIVAGRSIRRDVDDSNHPEMSIDHIKLQR